MSGDNKAKSVIRRAVSDRNQTTSVRAKLKRKLAGFTAEFPGNLDVWRMESVRPDAAEFPVPELILFALRDVMGFNWSGPGEKVRWTVYCSVESQPVAFQLRKFGFTILFQKGSSLALDRVKGQLTTALKALENYLEPFAHQQVDMGHVTIVNRFAEFDTRYRFFRESADHSYMRAAKPPAKLLSRSKKLQFAPLLNYKHQASQEGFFHSTAMVDAYFSCLEHRLLLLRAFTGKPLASGELRELLAAKWDAKINGTVRFWTIMHIVV